MQSPVVDDKLVIHPKPDAIIRDGVECVIIITERLDLAGPASGEEVRGDARSRTAAAEIKIDDRINARQSRRAAEGISREMLVVVPAAQARARTSGYVGSHYIQISNVAGDEAVGIRNADVIRPGI